MSRWGTWAFGLAGFAVACLASFVWCQRQSQASPQAAFASLMRGHLSRLDGASAPGRVVFLGNSTLQALDVSSVTPIGLNLSIGGERLADTLGRAASYRSLGAARALVLNVGFNDLIEDCQTPLATGLNRLLALAGAATPVFLLGVQQPAPDRQPALCGGRIVLLARQYNELLAQVCASRRLCTFVPNPTTQTPAGGAQPGMLAADGIHLSAKGYAELATRLRQAGASSCCE